MIILLNYCSIQKFKILGKTKNRYLYSNKLLILPAKDAQLVSFVVLR